jgi:hypothetical protein
LLHAKEGNFPQDVTVRRTKFVPYLTTWRTDLDTVLTGVQYELKSLLSTYFRPQNLSFVVTLANQIKDNQEIFSYCLAALADIGRLIVFDFGSITTSLPKDFPFQKEITFLHLSGSRSDHVISGKVLIFSKSEIDIERNSLKEIQNSENSIAQFETVISDSLPISSSYYKTLLLGVLPGKSKKQFVIV